jgi:hypothetical protein
MISPLYEVEGDGGEYVNDSPIGVSLVLPKEMPFKIMNRVYDGN